MAERPVRNIYTEEAPTTTPDSTGETAPDLPPVQEEDVTPDSIESTVAPTAGAPEEMAALPDAETRYTDAEILGKRYPVRQMVREAGNQRMKAVEFTQAKLKNARDTPAKFRLQFSKTIAESRYNRQQARVDAVAHLPQGNRIRARREAKLAKAEQRLARKTAAYESHTERMQQRREAVGTNAERRRTEYIADLKDRREQALARKAIRRELRSQGASLLETRSIVKAMPKEHLSRVGSVAAIAATSERVARRANRVEAKAIKHESKLVDKLDGNTQQARQLVETATTAVESVRSIEETELPTAKERVAKLTKRLETLPADSPDRDGLTWQLQEAQRQVDTYEQQDIPHWQRVIESSRQQAAELTAQRSAIQAQLRAQKETVARSSQTTDIRRSTADRHAQAAAHTTRETVDGIN